MRKIAIIGIIIIISIVIIGGYGIYTMLQSVSAVTAETKSLQTKLNDNQRILDNLNNQFVNTQNDKIQTSENLNEAIEELQLYQSAKKYVLHNPLYWEARNFLSADSTNKKTYNNITFNCANYAQEVNNNAENKGLRCAFVTVNFSDSKEGHALIAFDTTDQGLKFFDAMTDELINLQIGKNYWADCAVPAGNYIYNREPGYTIEAYTIYW